MKPNRIHSLLLAAVILFAAVLYFYRLGGESLSTQEYYSLYTAQKTLPQILTRHPSALNPNAPPLYYLLLHFWLKIFGQSELAQRSLSALFGVLSIYTLYRLTRLLFNRPTGILASGFAALSFTWLAIFRQNRCYSLFILLTLVSFLAFYSFLKDKGSRKWLWRLIAVNILLAYTHYLGFLVVALQALFGVWEWEKYKRGLLNTAWMCVGVALAYLPWAGNFLYDLRSSPLAPQEPPYFTPAALAFDFFRVLFHDFHFVWNPVLALIYIPFLVRGFVRIKERTLTSNPGGYLAATFIFPTAIFFFVMNIDRVRYFAPFMFPLLILLACGFQGLDYRSLGKKIAFLCMVTFIAGNNLLDLGEYLRTPLDEQWKQAAEKIKSLPGAGREDVFIFQSRFNLPVFAYYYWGPEAASGFVPPADYTAALSALGAQEKIAVLRESPGKEFFSQLEKFSPGSRLWVFRYHDPRFIKSFQQENQGRYALKRIPLNRTLPPVDLFLLKNRDGSSFPPSQPEKSQ